MLKIGDLLRVTSPANTDDPMIGEYKNYYFETTVAGHSKFNFRAGINKSSNIIDKNGISRCPVIVIDSNPSSSGSAINPWRDEFYPDRGIIKYYGDNKVFEKKGKTWMATKICRYWPRKCSSPYHSRRGTSRVSELFYGSGAAKGPR